MRRIIQLSVACLAASVVSACSSRDAVTETGVAPTGGVRFINAVPDTGGSSGLDFRFVDIVENNAHYAVPFRNTIVTSGGIPASTQIQFKATEAGAARHFRIFLDDSLTTVAQGRVGCAAAATTCIGDSTLNVASGHRYTALLWGNSRAGATAAMKLTVIDEACVPTDTLTQVGLRVINTSTTQAIDVTQYTGTTVPTTPTWSNVAPLSISTCVTVPIAAAIKFNVRNAGTTTNYVATDGTALVGVANGTTANGCLVGTDCDATPGTSAAGSVVTAIVFGPSVAGSKAAQFTTPAMSFMWDRRPTRNKGT